MMAERASIVDHSTLPRWAIRLMSLLDKEFAGRGRPKTDQQPERYQYRIEGGVATSLVRVEEARTRAGVFILATNDHSPELTMEALLAAYKAQQNVERGFRFLISPEFLMSSI